jgi:hypothetical protein
MVYTPMTYPDDLKKLGIDVLQDSPGNRAMRVHISDLSTVLLIAAASFTLAFLIFVIAYNFWTTDVVWLNMIIYAIYYGVLLTILLVGCLPFVNYMYNPYHIEIESDCMDVHLRGFLFLTPCIRRTEYLSDIVYVSVNISSLSSEVYVEFQYKDGRTYRLLKLSTCVTFPKEKPIKVHAVADILNRWIEEEKDLANETTEANDET